MYFYLTKVGGGYNYYTLDRISANFYKKEKFVENYLLLDNEVLLFHSTVNSVLCNELGKKTLMQKTTFDLHLTNLNLILIKK